MSLNSVYLRGNLTRDPEKRFLPSGTAVVNFGLAVKIATRIEDGINLQNAIDKTMIDAKELNYNFGFLFQHQH